MADLMDKAAARKAALARRAAAHGAVNVGAGALSAFLAGYRGVPLAGYLPMRTEIDPRPAMAEAAAHGPVCAPIIMGKGMALQFRQWQPDSALIPGEFGAPIPESGDWIIPEILIVPLVAFDRNGGRLGYGGGFYDRTLEHLRARGPVLAIGFAYAAQEAQDLLLEPTDQPMDLIITEAETISIAP